MNKRKLLDYAQGKYTDIELLELEHAIDFATEHHAGQKRRSGEPYIIHPLAVTKILIDWRMDIDSVLAGVLHDTVEDTSVTLDHIESLFGADVAFLVDGVTKVSRARSGMDNLDTYRPHTKQNLAKLLMAVGHDIRVIIIKLADRLHNLQTLQYMPPHKQVKVARESLDIFAPIADRIGMGRVRMQIEDISFRYLDPPGYRRTEALRRKRLGKSTRKLGAIRDEVSRKLTQNHIEAEINGRVKTVYSLYKKLRKVHGDIDSIYDLMALRVIVKDRDTCYEVLNVLHDMYEPMLDRFKDYIVSPKPNGYRSLHTTVTTPQGRVVEFQIRTNQMHEYAEQGLAASFHYNEQKLSKGYQKRKEVHDKDLTEQLVWVLELQKIAKQLQSGEEVKNEHLYIDLFDDTIFVYSPRGDIFSLPQGALPLDFAYLLHSDLAKRTYGFKVNGKIHAFDKPLQNGDTIEVITRESSSPKHAWQDLVTTHHARNKLRSQLRRNGALGAISNAAAIIKAKAARGR